MRALIRAAFVVLVAVASARAQPAPATDLDSLLKESADAYRSGQFVKGFALLETVRDRAHADGLPSQEIEALSRLSMAYAFRGAYDTATATLAQARELAVHAQRAEDGARITLQMAQVANTRQ